MITHSLILKLKPVNGIELAVPLLLLDGLFLKFDFCLFWSIELPGLQVFEANLIALPNKLDFLLARLLFFIV
jgi:hypothetical protein